MSELIPNLTCLTASQVLQNDPDLAPVFLLSWRYVVVMITTLVRSLLERSKTVVLVFFRETDIDMGFIDAAHNGLTSCDD